jgi:TetR/AcrR family transcriptional regulator, mexJK operon transcriptional repressor
MRGGVARRSGGRPTATAAAVLETTILDAATSAFLADGYAATTIEAIAKACAVAKRTIYARWSGKPALFRAVLERLIARWLSGAGDWADAGDLEAALNEAASRILDVALTPEAIALHRLLIAESARFPELPLMLHQAGASQGTERIAVLLDGAIARGTLPAQDTAFAAEQFLHLLLTGPQRRALGLGPKLDEQQTLVWRRATIALFLRGVRS